MTKPPSARILATIYACSERSIRNYRAEGAPLHDPAAMFAWWASRKNLPKGAATKGLAAVQEAFATVVGSATPGTPTPATSPGLAVLGSMHIPVDDQRGGAEHELRWLESLAVEARRNLVQAHRSGNALTQKQALDSYLKITEGLRKFDNQVSQERRSSEEMIARAQVEDSIINLTVWLRRGVENFINSACLQIAECERPEDVYVVVAEPLRHCLSNAVEAAYGAQKFPLWMKQAFETGL